MSVCLASPYVFCHYMSSSGAYQCCGPICHSSSCDRWDTGGHTVMMSHLWGYSEWENLYYLVCLWIHIGTFYLDFVSPVWDLYGLQCVCVGVRAIAQKFVCTSFYGCAQFSKFTLYLIYIQYIFILGLLIYVFIWLAQHLSATYVEQVPSLFVTS